MRITTSMVYNQGVGGMQQQTSKLLHIQQQLNTGRRIVTPEDDPIGAARALEVGQSAAVNTQFSSNIAYANDNLKLIENRLNGVTDILHYVRERAVQAGDGIVVSGDDLKNLATDMRAQFDALLALANSQDGNGDFLFSGYKAQTQPFNGTIAGVTYAGDQGTRSIQVSEWRSLPISVPGSDLFENTRSLDANSLYSANGQNNTGTGAVSLAYNPNPPALSNTGRRYEITYDAAVVAPANPYTVIEYVPGNPTPVTIGTATFVQDATPGAAPGAGVLSFNGIDATVTGAPEDEDAFDVNVASKSLFQNMALFIDGLERPGASRMAGTVAFTLDNLDGGLENLLRIHTEMGSHMVEADNLQNMSADLALQHQTRLSELQDVDFIQALSDLMRVKFSLDAAQSSYADIARMSLLNYLR